MRATQFMNGPLDNQQLDRFQADGYLVCPDLLHAADHAAIADMVEEIAAWPMTDDRWQHYRERTAGGPVLTRTENFLPYHDGLRDVLTIGTLIEAVSQLFGETAVVFKEKINYKLPGGAGFAPHQDAKAYAYGTSHITCLVAVDDNTIENGCLWFSPGMHQDGLLPTDDTGCLPTEAAEKMEWIAATMPTGGVTFFSSFVPHKSLPNHSQHSRRSLYVTYSRAGEGDLRSAYYAERQRAMSQHAGAESDPPRISTIGHFQGEAAD